MKNLVIISGKQGSGKSTLTQELKKMWEQKGNCRKVAIELKFAGPIYAIHDFARDLLKRLGVKIPAHLEVKDGPMLQWLGTEWGRKTIADDVWTQCARGAVDRIGATSDALIMFSDCRFKNEFDTFPEALRVRLECPKEVRKERAEMWRDNDTHISETDLDDHVYAGKFDMVFDTQHSSVTHIATMIMAQLDKKVWLEKRKC